MCLYVAKASLIFTANLYNTLKRDTVIHSTRNHEQNRVKDMNCENYLTITIGNSDG